MRALITAAVLTAAMLGPAAAAGADKPEPTKTAPMPFIDDIPYLFNPFDGRYVAPRPCELRAIGLDLPYLANPFDGRDHAPGVHCHHHG